MTHEQRIILKQYNELKTLSGSNNISLSEKNNTKYLKTLKFLETKKYIQSLNVDGGSMYIKNEAFDDFEENYREEIGEPLPKIFALYSRVEDLRGKFQFVDDGCMIRGNIIYKNSEFISWKSEVIYELRNLVNNDTVNELIDIFNSFNGLAEENKFVRCASLLKVVIDNYDDFIPNKSHEKTEIVENNNMKQKKIFISHASKDINCVASLVDLLETLGFNKSNLLCSSVPGYGIPLGEKIYDYLRNHFTDFDLHIIFVLSENFYNSAACLNEMGATWVHKSNHTTLLLPGFQFSDMKGVIEADRIAISLEDNDAKYRLNEMRISLSTEFGLTDIDPNRWEMKRDEFLIKCNIKTTEGN